MIRVFVSESLQKNHSVLLTDKQSHYLLHVMRCKQGDSILCFNTVDGEWQGYLSLVTKKQVAFIPQTQTKKQNNRDFCAICPALIKKEHFDLVLQKATELNVTDIYPLKLERSVISVLNMERANLILAEAAEQSERLTIPKLHPVMDLKTFLTTISNNISICYLSERGQEQTTFQPIQNPAFIVGPEGGFTPKELSLLESHKSCAIHFPATILRAETASIAALACWQLSKFMPVKK